MFKIPTIGARLICALMVISTLILLSSAQVYTLTSGYKNLKTVCYQTIGTETINVKITSGYPSLPAYLQMESELKLYPVDTELTTKTFKVVYDMKRVDGDCDSSYFASTTGIEFSTMILDIKLFTAITGWPLFSHTNYTFLKDFDFCVDKLWDEDKYIGIDIEFKNVGTELMPKFNRYSSDILMASINRIPATNQYLCVITSTKQRLIFTRQWRPNTLPSFHIAALTMTTYSNDKQKLVETPHMTAFGCVPGEQLIAEDVKIFHDIQNYELFPFILEGIDSVESSQKPYELVEKKTAFELRDTPFIHCVTRNTHYFNSYTSSATAQSVFFVNKNIKTEVCTDASNQYTQLSKSGKRLFAYKYEDEEECEDVYRSKWIQKQTLGPC